MFQTRVSLLLAFSILALLAGRAVAQQVQVEVFTLDNGMKFLLVPRTDQPNNIAAGWVAKVGSVNERPGITGISHFFEHMMFKGTDTIGTRDAKADREFMNKQKAIKDQMNALVFGVQYKRWKNGEIDDPWDSANDTEELKSLRAQLNTIMEEHRNAIVKNEFDSVYTKLGGSGMNAFTTYDLTFYFINVPSNKFELWAWMESDRLANSVFREFYAERDVVHEERRLRTESTPTGVFQEQFDAMFWQSSPYSWPVIGWTSDLNSYTMDEAQRYFDIYYRPNNLVGVIVGDFDPDAVKPVIREYFSRLKRGEQEPPPVVTLEMPQMGEKRMYAECDCQPQIEIRYHIPPFNHSDSFALEIMARLLNGRTGRLYKAMVEGKKIASSAATGTSYFGGPAKYGAYFSFDAEIKGDATPENLEQGWYGELAKLQNELVGERELQKVKNQVAAEAYRRLQSNFFILLQLGFYEAVGGWEFINESPAKLQAVTAEDIQRVAKKYFEPTNRSVAVYTRKAGSAPEDPELAGISAEVRAKMIAPVMEMINAKDDPAELENMYAQMSAALPMMEARKNELPPGAIDGMKYVLKKLRERIDTLNSEKN
jgi:predicted Zn-dependent peptidase